MSDHNLVQIICQNILLAIGRIERRFETIEQPDDFVKNDAGVDRLDGITMMLIAIGEQLKQLEKVTAFELRNQYPQVDWKGAKGVRDFLSHHYFAVDAEVIFDICQNKLVGVKVAIQDLADNSK